MSGSWSAAEVSAMRRALALAESVGVLPGPNPRVGAVLLDAGGRELSVGRHRGVGTPHAEVDAIAAAPPGSTRGATAVVTLEPCTHVGRTGPCTQALIDAGVARVIYAVDDPNPAACGGASVLRAAGIEVSSGLLQAESLRLNEIWDFAVRSGRPWVTLKVAGSLDGRVAASDGTSRWITGPEARADVHELRREVGAVMVGSRTALIDDASLTARERDNRLSAYQPLRVVVGTSSLRADSRVMDASADTLVLPTRHLREALKSLADREIRHVMLEGGPTLSAAFLRAGLVDAIRWYVAPTLLGSGRSAIGDLGIESIGQALRWTPTAVRQFGDDVRIDLRPSVEAADHTRTHPSSAEKQAEE